MPDNWFKCGPTLSIVNLDGDNFVDPEDGPDQIPAGMRVEIDFANTTNGNNPVGYNKSERYESNHSPDFLEADEIPADADAVTLLMHFVENFEGPDTAAICISAGELKSIAAQLRSKTPGS